MVDSYLTMSARALGAHQRAAEAYRREKAHEGLMDRGPYLSDDGEEIIIPSYFYNKEAPAAYKKLGFRFNGASHWWRRVDWAFRGTIYSCEAWLKAARKAYKQVWPNWVLPAGRCAAGGQCDGIGWREQQHTGEHGELLPLAWYPCLRCNPDGTKYPKPEEEA